jgi:hypothetical protein
MEWLNLEGISDKKAVKKYVFLRNNNMCVKSSFTNDETFQHDGSTQQLAGCLRDFRNKPFPVKARIEYYRNVLTVSAKKTGRLLR